MTREEAINQISLEKDYIEDILGSDNTVKALDMATEALAKIEVIQRIVNMPIVWEPDDRRRYAKVVDIVRKDLEDV